MKRIVIAACMGCSALAMPALGAEMLSGGWQATVDPSVTSEAQEAFGKAIGDDSGSNGSFSVYA